jgi:hypothetical protein
LIVLALAQIGIHLVFFLHLGSGPDSTNNILALAFGVRLAMIHIEPVMTRKTISTITETKCARESPPVRGPFALNEEIS